MRYHIKVVTFVLLLLAIPYFYDNAQQKQPYTLPNQKTANFDQTQLDYIRSVIHVAGSKYAINFDMLSLYIQMQIEQSFPSFWNVAVYRKQDQNTNFYVTGTADATHTNKRYYQVVNPENFNFSVLILETNNTDINPTSKKEKSNSQLVNTEKQSKSFLMNKIEQKTVQSKVTVQGGLQYTKKKSPKLTSSQEAGIDLAITTAYTWNKNIIDFSKVLQRLTETNLNQHWQVCTRMENLSNFSFLYTSPYDEWIEYIGYELGSYVLHVYLYRNYING